MNGVQSTRIDPAFCDELRARVVLSAVIARTVALRKRGREFAGLCPFHGEKSPSFTVNDAKGFFHCFGCGAHGDAIGFLMKAQGLSFPAAVEALARECGMADRLGLATAPASVAGGSAAQESVAAQEARRAVMAQRQALAEAERRAAGDVLALARRQWRAAAAIWGTAAEIYLSKRGIDCGALARAWAPSSGSGQARSPLRFHPALPHSESRQELPALLAAILRVDEGPRRFIGLHRTYLRADGNGKAEVTPNKKVLGAVSGGAIRLAPAGEHLVLAEGIETALSVMQATGLPAWAAVSLGNLAGRGDEAAAARAPFHPTRRDEKTGRRLRLPTVVADLAAPGLALPAQVRRLTIAADNDSKDPAGARCLIERAANRFARLGLRVDIAWPPDGADFNDVLRRVG